MKNHVHQTLLPLTAVLLILGLSLQVMLHFRQKKALENTSATSGFISRTLQQTNLLEQIWNTKTASVGEVNNKTRYQDQRLAQTLLQLRQLTTGNENLLAFVEATEQRMMRSETVADSLQSISGQEAQRQAQTLMLQTNLSVAETLQGLKEKLQADAEVQTTAFLATQKRSEMVTMNSLAITMLAFVAFLYLLFQDYQTLRRQQEPALDDIKTAAHTEAYTDEQTASHRGLYRRRLILESLGKNGKEPKIAMPVNK